MNKNKQLLLRLVFLLVFSLVIVGIFWLGNNLSRPQEPVLVDIDGFLPSEKGKAVLVEYSDFQCPACRMYYPFIDKLKGEFTDDLTVVYKYFPLRNIHKNADLAARAGESARLQDKFSGMEKTLFEQQDEWGNSDQALSLFQTYAKDLGLDVGKFTSDIDSSLIQDKVDSDYEEGVRLGVSGTPTFFLNGKKMTNPRSYDEFKSVIEQAIR